jgi:hypothetical protein
MRFMGVAGIALSTSLVYVGSFAFVSVATLKVLSGERFSPAAAATADTAP